MLEKNQRILIVGLGLIGGSMAAALSAAGYEVAAVDTRREALDIALSRGYIKDGYTAPGEFVSEFDTVIFALYPHTLLQVAPSYAAYISPGTLVTDATGVKAAIVDKMQALMPAGAEFVGAHPMAGREVSGVENATPTLFCGANFIVTPTAANSEAAISRCEAIGRALGASNISRLSPERHDEMIGFLSQLTHCIAVALMTCKESRHLVDYTGDSFRDLTRIAKINEDMWWELFCLNREELLSQMDLFLEHFATLRRALAEGDEDKMKEIMRLSTERRRYFDK